MTGPPPPRSALTRRGLLRASLLGAGAAALTGCSSVSAGLLSTPPDPRSVAYWNLFGGGDGVRMRQMENGYRKANPNIALRSVTLTWGNPYYTKLALSTVGDRPPDVAASHLTRMKTLVQGNLLQELHPEDLERHGITAEKFTSRAWEASLVDGKIYAIPIDTHPFVLYYNTDICARAGLLDADGDLKPIEGPDAFQDALSKAKQVTGQYGATHGITSPSSPPWQLFQTLYAQLGGEVLADDGARIVLDDAKAKQVLDYLRMLTVEKRLMPGSVDYQGAIALFASGAAGFHLNGGWEITTFQEAKMPFSMALVPNIFGGPYKVQADSHTLVLPVRPEKDRAALDRALGFVRSMLDQSLTWAKGGHVPTWLPVANGEAYQTLTPQSQYAAAAASAVYDPPAWYSGSGSNFVNIMGSAVGAVEAGDLSPADAIAQIRSKLAVLAATASPV
ncbi:carbohydrate ABC transporter substrate-binding protein (CUT1 family) [Prauserella shujinwangii]|uniref:Carbohydrate ABC transporter substrate-binding protein (CUT1 family) n=1 Tax=Prauserella shujinwangii TaxID=1453103 RepID=A0A2T0LRQ2_9PSEU|nr:extracellular solute-binding protein [Prauserella shujinwangii]PRX46179.1 carbohydrate ABC transporter substrate-binding protein (CUT1 family) [Prauserella shujinwangii]